MANIKSQIKRNRQNERRRVRNKAVGSKVKTAVKQTRLAAETGDAEGATARLREASRLLDRAATRGVMHRKTAARRKSRLAKLASRASG